jgi:hypothetical protein
MRERRLLLSSLAARRGRVSPGASCQKPLVDSPPATAAGRHIRICFSAVPGSAAAGPLWGPPFRGASGTLHHLERRAFLAARRHPETVVPGKLLKIKHLRLYSWRQRL